MDALYYSVTIYTPDGEREITLRAEYWWDDVDKDGSTSEAVVRWCSRHGYSYDECDWEYTDTAR